MRIGIDGRMLGKGYGLARYIEQLLLHLEMQDSTNEYIIFLKRENWNAFEPKNKNFTKVLADIHWYGWKEQLFFPRIIKKQKVDLMHFPHFNVPLFYTDPFVVTIHDLIMFHYPRQEASTHGAFLYFFKDIVHRFVVRHALHYSKHIFVTSQFTKSDVHQTFGTVLEKMTVTYQAPFALEKKDFEREHPPVLEKYHITKPYIMYVGAAYPHKNLEVLLKAWKIFEKTHDGYELLLIGKENFFYKRLLQTPEWKACQNVVYTGFVPDFDLEVLYREAKLFVFPSLYEGFGLPALEALARGLPVISSHATCLPEVLQEAVLYFDPKNPEEIVNLLTLCLVEGLMPQDSGEKTQQLLSQYSWERLCQQTLLIYKSVLESQKEG